MHNTPKRGAAKAVYDELLARIMNPPGNVTRYDFSIDQQDRVMMKPCHIAEPPQPVYWRSKDKHPVHGPADVSFYRRMNWTCAPAERVAAELRLRF